MLDRPAGCGWKPCLALVLFALVSRTVLADNKPVHLTCEHQVDPLAIDVTPRFSWQLADTRRGACQTAYRIQVVALDPYAMLWDTGKVESDRSVLVPYEGPPLGSRKRYAWRVYVWDQEGALSPCSDPALFETGILNPQEWRAQWIGISANAALLRRSFTVQKRVVRARVYATARGLYRLRFNGQPVGNAAFAPDWTDYRVRSSYQAYDVTAHVRPGENVVGAFLGKGWYGSELAWLSLPPYRYGAAPVRLFCELHLDYDDGSHEAIVTDPAWKATPGPILDSTLYDGETYDARKEETNWDVPGFQDGHWWSVNAVSLNVALSAQRAPTIQVTESIRPLQVTARSGSVYLVDMGQNMVGWVRLRVRGTRGTQVQIRYGETLTAYGDLDTYSLRSARATDTYILKGASGDEFFEPRFTYHGFRYVEIQGYPGVPTVNDVTGQVVHTAARFTGAFTCSSDLVNQIWSNVWWSQRGNLFSVPTDCPQRDERLGWMGDAQAFWQTACYNMDLASVSDKWMQDIREAQRSTGLFQDIAPEIPGLKREGSPFWSDAGIVVPWTAWRMYGDVRIVTDSWSAMEKWMAHVRAHNPNYVWEQELGENYGDWLAPSGNPAADRPLLATAVWAENARMMAEMAEAIGKPTEAETYRQLYARIRNAFGARYVNSQGVVGTGHQTPLALALRHALVPWERYAAAASHLVSAVEQRGNHLSTGFVGTSSLLPALSMIWRDDVAFRVLSQTTYPSWGHMIRNGATTMWERWDNFEVCRQRSSSMCSFNHFCFGGVGDWLYRYLAGIDVDPAGPGFRRFVIHPHLVDGLTFVDASHECPYGTIRSRWENHGYNFALHVTVPPNTRAVIHVPGTHVGHILEHGRPITLESGLVLLGEEGGFVVFDAPAGTYEFTAAGLAADGSPRVGRMMGIRLRQRRQAGDAYQLALSESNATGIPVPNLGVIPLDPGVLFLFSMSHYFPTVFVNFRGYLDANGEAVAGLVVPPISQLVGTTLYMAGVTYDHSGITYISNGLTLKIGP